jgi:hypothetical protein
MTMGLVEALRKDCALWPGTQESLSQAAVGSAQGLRHKLAGYKGSYPGLEDAQTLMLLTGGRHTIIEQARELGGVFLSLPPVDADIDNADLAIEVGRLQTELGQVFAVINDALADDNKIDGGERRDIDAQAHRAVTKLMRYLALVYRVYGDNAFLPLQD